MRSDFKGAELSERIGGATAGGGFVQDYTALGGQTWRGCHALASVEYLHQDSILARARDFTSGAPPVNSLLQAETKTSVFVNLGQDLTPWASFHLDGLYSQRRTGYLDQLAPGGLIYALAIGVQSYFVAPSLDFTLPAGWSGSLSGTASGSSDTTNYFFTGGPAFVGLDHRADDVEASANGPIFSLPSGVVKLALGAGHRDEHFDEVDNPGTSMAGSRSVTYVFGEVFAALVQPADDRFLLHALDLSVAGRWERYSDFGSTANPKVGLRYKPLDGVTLRATWGTSFKAPQFLQTTLQSTIYQYPAATLGGSGAGDALLTFGGSSDLKPERATSWTAGIDWSPPAWRSLQVSATYFNIDYTNRIVQPISGVGTALANPAYAPFIITHPTAPQQAAAIASASVFYNLASDAYDPANIDALIEDRFTNAASQKIDGVDLSIKQALTLNAANELDAFASASWLHIVQQSAPGGPQQTLTGYLFNPPKLRVRAGLTWTSGPLAATGIANYISAETDNGVAPNVPIGAWTTLDLNMTYKIGRVHPRLPSLEASVSINNVLDAAPPFAKGAAVGAPGYNFDSTNASALGRFFAFTLRQRL
jgi:outer membrane receptor protein involved in Fe transport